MFIAWPVRTTWPAMPVPIGIRISAGRLPGDCATFDQSSPRASSARNSEARSAATTSPIFSVNASSTWSSMIPKASSVLMLTQGRRVTLDALTGPGVGERSASPSECLTGVECARLESRTVALALQGGGALGAYTWGVLDALLADG